MGIDQGLGHLDHYCQSSCWGQWPIGRQLGAKGGPGCKLHDDSEHALVDDEVSHRDDAWTIELSEGESFMDESLHQLWIVIEL